jgi:hypothetical protein
MSLKASIPLISYIESTLWRFWIGRILDNLGGVGKELQKLMSRHCVYALYVRLFRDAAPSVCNCCNIREQGSM